VNLRQQRIKRRRDGSYKLDLPDDERTLLASLPGQLQEVLEHQPDDPALRRLFPPAYPVDRDEEDEYRRLMGDDLAAGHLQALQVLGATAAENSLTEEQLMIWLRAINQLRLVLGTRLDVDEETSGMLPDPEEPDADVRTVFIYLGWLQEQVVEALS